VGLRPPRAGALVLDVAVIEQTGELPRARVGPGVVGHQPPDLDPLVREEPKRALGEGDHGLGILGVEDLRVGEPRVVVDDRVRVLLAGSPRLAGAVAGDRVAGAIEARVALRVHVQQIPRARPLVAVWRLAGRLGQPRASVPLQGAVNGRVRVADRAGDQPRPPAGVRADLADPLLLRSGQLVGAAVGAARAVVQATERAPR